MTMTLIVNGTCTQEHWQTCLHKDCQKHARTKAMFGFGEDKWLDTMEASEPFRRKRAGKKGKQSFLGQRADSVEPQQN